MNTKTVIASISVIFIIYLILSTSNKQPTLSDEITTKVATDDKNLTRLDKKLDENIIQSNSPHTISEFRNEDEHKQLDEDKLPPLNEVTVNGEVVDCTDYQLLDADEDYLIFKAWTAEHIFGNYEKLKPYGYYTEQELIDLTESNDSLAMYSLAVNYEWQIENETYPSRKLLYDSDNRIRKRTDFNHTKAEQARAWYLSAAIHNRPSALFKILDVIQEQLTHLNREKKYEQVNTLFEQGLIYINLAKHIAPQFSDIANYDNNQFHVFRDRKLVVLELENDESKKRVKQGTEQMIELWTRKRTELNLPIIYQLEKQFPKELKEGTIKAVTQLMCGLQDTANQRR